jgi:hypothetical protein
VAWVEFPDISELRNTSKGWQFSGGLYHPKAENRTWNLDLTIPPVTSYYTTNWMSQLLGGYVVTAPDPNAASFLPPPELPSEKREMPVIGYRAWGFSSKFRVGVGRDVALKSTGVNYHWLPGDNHALCTGATSGPGGHRAPDQRCHCGFYVLASLDEVEGHQQVGDGIVVGAVMGWGKVVQHGTEGWRAEYAKIIALLDCKYSKGQLRNTQQAAAAYGVEVKSRDALEAMVGEFGDPFAA